MFVRLKLEETPEGLRATISQRDDNKKISGKPSVDLVRDKKEAKQKASALARSLGLTTYGFVDKTSADRAETAASGDHPGRNLEGGVQG